jgi:DNA-binding transcriptional ArsR family regulator
MSSDSLWSIGPLTEVALERARPDSGQSRIEDEWMRSLERDGDFLLFWGGAFRDRWGPEGQREPFALTWQALLFSIDEERQSSRLADTPPEHVELMLSSLAHAARIRLLQALLGGPKPSSELTDRTGLRGGNLYYHLKELAHAHYVEQRQGLWRLTRRGAQMIITVTCLASVVVEEEGGGGPAVSAWRDERRGPSPAFGEV